MTSLTSPVLPEITERAPVFERLLSAWPRPSTVEHITKLIDSRDRDRADGWDPQAQRPGDIPPLVMIQVPPVENLERLREQIEDLASARPVIVPGTEILDRVIPDDETGDMTALLSQPIETDLPPEDQPTKRRRRGSQPEQEVGSS